jgi:hypothetical protein
VTGPREEVVQELVQRALGGMMTLDIDPVFSVDELLSAAFTMLNAILADVRRRGKHTPAFEAQVTDNLLKMMQGLKAS